MSNIDKEINVIRKEASTKLKDFKIRVEMLGTFAIYLDGKLVVELTRRYSRAWKLTQFMLTYRHKALTHQEMADALCRNDKTTNPINIIRTLVYRSRVDLEECGIPFAAKLIASSNHGYRWNRTVNCSLDIEEFDDLMKKAKQSTKSEDRLRLLLEAAELYKGNFLPANRGEEWVVPIERWYRLLFLECAREALMMLIETERYNEAETLSFNANIIDPFDEKILEYHIQALIGQGKTQQALEAYRRNEGMFYDVLGVGFSDSLRALFDQIKYSGKSEDAPLDSVLEEWVVGSKDPGAFYCELSVFKAVMQIEARSMTRSKRTVYVARLETNQEPGEKDTGIMKQLGLAIQSNLRKGDLFTLSQPGQYMLMLSHLTMEDCKMLIKRILRSVASDYDPESIEVTISPVLKPPTTPV